jgi:hypothetical protein
MTEFIDAFVQKVNPTKGIVTVIDQKYHKQHIVPYTKFFYAKFKGMEIVPKKDTIGLIVITPEKKIFFPIQATIVNEIEKNASKFPLGEGDVAFINDTSLIKISENELLIKYQKGIQIHYDHENGLFLIKTKSLSIYDHALYYSTNYNDQLDKSSPSISFSDKPENEDNFFQVKLFDMDQLLKVFLSHKDENIFNFSITDKKYMLLSIFNLNISINEDSLSLNFNDSKISISNGLSLKTPDFKIETDNAEVVSGNVKLTLNQNNGKIQSGENSITISENGIDIDGNNININADNLNLTGSNFNVESQNANFDIPTSNFQGDVSFRKGQENSFDVTNQQELDAAIKELEVKFNTKITKVKTDISGFKGRYAVHTHTNIAGPTTPPSS